ncbi:MAG TPA: IclR family transcriptional regulator [Burkholderiaceae bacterium]|jgi:DNA-binding IclR family transcriptional regulator
MPKPSPPEASTPSARSPIYAETLDDKQFATTLARGLEILRCFTPQAPVLGNKELAQGTGLPKATVSRFTYTLTRLGYLRPAPNQNKHQLGSAVLSLSYPLLATMYIRQFARGPMNELANELGGSVAMGIRDRLNIVYVETSRSQTLSAPPFTEIGFAHPIAATSIGRAYMAACEPKAREALLNEIRVKTPADWARYRAKIHASQKDFVRLGFCLSVDFFRPGIYGVGTALRRPIDGEIIVLNCAVYADRVSRERLESYVGPRLLALARRLENG